MATRPRLKQGETPQSASYQKRLADFNRQAALAEATAAQEEQNKRESAKRRKRDVLDEVSSAVKQADDDAKPKRKPKPKSKKKDRIAESGRSALEGRAKQLEDAIEGK